MFTDVMHSACMLHYIYVQSVDALRVSVLFQTKNFDGYNTPWINKSVCDVFYRCIFFLATSSQTNLTIVLILQDQPTIRQWAVAYALRFRKPANVIDKQFVFMATYDVGNPLKNILTFYKLREISRAKFVWASKQEVPPSGKTNRIPVFVRWKLLH